MQTILLEQNPYAEVMVNQNGDHYVIDSRTGLPFKSRDEDDRGMGTEKERR